MRLNKLLIKRVKDRHLQTNSRQNSK